MARPRKHNPPARASQPKEAAQAEIATQPEPQVLQVDARTAQSIHSFEGPIPPPELFRQYDTVVPGAGERILAMAERESAHRHELEARALNANIQAQQTQLQINDLQVKSTFKSDTLGQTYGFLVSAGCVIGSIVAGVFDQTALSLALAAIPSAAIVKAFLNK